jgi:hypothetical protein
LPIVKLITDIFLPLHWLSCTNDQESDSALFDVRLMLTRDYVLCDVHVYTVYMYVQVYVSVYSMCLCVYVLCAVYMRELLLLHWLNYLKNFLNNNIIIINNDKYWVTLVKMLEFSRKSFRANSRNLSCMQICRCNASVSRKYTKTSSREFARKNAACANSRKN